EQPRLRRPHRAAERLRHLRLAEALEIEQNGDARVVGQREDRLLELAAHHFTLLSRGGAVVGSGAAAVANGVEPRVGLRALLASIEIDERVAQDAKQPRLEIAAAGKLIDGSERTRERLLHEIF